jgi:hypothetical protein
MVTWRRCAQPGLDAFWGFTLVALAGLAVAGVLPWKEAVLRCRPSALQVLAGWCHRADALLVP